MKTQPVLAGIAIALLFSVKSHCQKVGIIPQVAVNANTMSISSDNNFNDAVLDKQTYFIRPSFGIDCDFTLSQRLSLRPGIHIARRGTKFTNVGFESFEGLEDDFSDNDDFLGQGGSADLTIHNKITYLHIPVNLNFRTEIGDDVYLNFSAGPYVGVALDGYVSVEGEVSFFIFSFDIDEEEDLNFDRDVKRLDYGANFSAGVEISNFMINLGYGLGLADISGTDPMYSGDEIKNRFIILGVGYRIGF